MKPQYQIIAERNIPPSLKEFEIEVSVDTLSIYRARAVASFTENAELPGFRKGKAPEELVIKEIGEMRIVERAADSLINDVVIAILSEKQIKFIGRPEITVTALAPGNPLKFKMSVAIVPEIALPDYKAIAKRINAKKSEAIEVQEKEIEESIQQIRKMFQGKDSKSEELPELTDERVKQLGNFENVEQFKERLRQDILADKKRAVREKKRLELIEAILTETPIDVPDVLVEHELDRIEAEFKADVTRLGMKIDEYLHNIKKTTEDLRKEWKGNAVKRAKLELIIPRIARSENIKLSPEEIDTEVKHLLEHHKDADKESARLYIERLLLHQKVLELLEGQS